MGHVPHHLIRRRQSAKNYFKSQYGCAKEKSQADCCRIASTIPLQIPLDDCPITMMEKYNNQRKFLK